MTQGHTTMTQMQLGVFKDCLSSGSTTVLGTKTSSVNVSDPALPIPFTLFSFSSPTGQPRHAPTHPALARLSAFPEASNLFPRAS